MLPIEVRKSAHDWSACLGFVSSHFVASRRITISTGGCHITSQRPFRPAARKAIMSDSLDEVKNTENEPQHLKPDHLIIMVNGLFGHMDNWKVIRRSMENSGSIERVLMLASNTNLKLQTFDGIDTCGKRLADELKSAIKETPSLKYISVFGHSMGGLIARHAIGLLYDRQSGKIQGLEPRHFISLATPHLGVGGTGPAQVPFIKWFSKLPLLGYSIGSALRGMSNPFAENIMRRTGSQFFLIDDDQDMPLLLRMAEDNEDESFLSSLRAFASRTCIANSSGDHLVGWANASIRAVEELPDLGDVSKAKGVVREDDVSMAFWQTSDFENGLTSRHSEGNGGCQLDEKNSSQGSLQSRPSKRKASKTALVILKSLQSLPWCRMDCSFKGTKFPFFAHNLIQVTREWINWEGEDMTKDIAKHFCKLEQFLREREGRSQKLG